MTGRHRILVADDDPSILQWVSQRLVSDGHDVVSVADGYAAIDAARLQTFALALLDVSMPVFSGTEVAEALRATNAHFDIKIVFHTELSEAWVRDLFAGYDLFLGKPTPADTLSDGVRALLSSPSP